MAAQWSLRLAVLALLSLNFLVSALGIEYCSDLNTANGNGNYSQYQSNGLCYDWCLSDYAFAILQGSDCWCSDYVPGATTSTDDCNVPCPGYPDDLCGNEASGLFGYLSIPGIKALGTKGGDTPSSTATQATSSTNNPTKATATTALSTSDSSSSMTWTPTPVVSIQTVSGLPITVTITPTVPPNSQNVSPVVKHKSGGLSTGGAVGLTIGLVALVALVCAIIYFCWRRREKERESEAVIEDSRRTSSAGLGGPVPSRTMSENSRYVLNTDGRKVVESYEADAPGSRRSRLMPVDPRLNPHAPLYQRGENKSRESVNTIRDDHDYSRRVHQQGPILRATNPDD